MGIKEKFEKILKKVSQPQRYLSCEKNFILKENPSVKILLVFPDLYEIGMAHYGFQLLYFLGNSFKEVQVERGFLPWFDLKEKMEENDIPFLSFETKTEAKKFDLVAFTLPTPLHFTNLIYALSLMKTPFKWKERGEKDPIIIAGGMACSNPAPLIEILDAIAIGDGEILFPQIINILKEKRKKIDTLEELSKIEGIIVPPLNKLKTKRVILKNLEEPFLFIPIFPSFPSIHNRFTVEIMRGCPWGCRFCQAGFWYRPYREANLEKIFKFLIKNVPETGFREIGLLSLSSSDIENIFDFCKSLMEYFEKKNVSISMPSLRVDTLSFPLIEILQKVRKGSLTFAPETGESLRIKINKPIKDEEIIKVLKKAKDLGWRRVKFYFMLGLPFEKEEDLKEIIRLIKEIKKLKFPFISLNFSNFVPKPWTPFQNFIMNDLKELKEKQIFLKENLKVKAKFLEPEFSIIEERISRGGKELSDLLIEAYKKNIFFDAWEEHLNKNLYISILPQTKLFEKKPWEEFIDFEIKEDYFKKEYEKARINQTTISCNKGCSICMKDCDIKRKKEKFIFDIPKVLNEKKEKVFYRFYLTKKENAKFLSYVNYINFISGYLISKGYPVLFSSGFNPRPLVSSYGSLPVGLESEEEILDIAFFKEAEIKKEEISNGIKILNVEKIKGKKELKGILFEYKGKKIILKSHKDLKLKEFFELKKIKNIK